MILPLAIAANGTLMPYSVITIPIAAPLQLALEVL